MSTTDATTRRANLGWYVGIATGVAIALGLAIAVGSAGHPDTAAGIVVGGMATVALAVVGRWRSTRATDRAGTAARIAAGRPDERDIRVHHATLAVVGVVAIILSALASAATFLDVDGTTIVRSMPFALVITMVGAFVLIDRRS
jgi:hypothetical protein